jgi:enediyne biosynthesis protein E4
VGGRFQDASTGAGPWFTKPTLARGLAVTDLDRDGRPDVVVNSLDAPAALLKNTSVNRSIVLTLVARHGQVPFGATVRATVGGREFARQLPSGGSYLSASEPRVFLGSGNAPKVERLSVTWPWGLKETWQDLPNTGALRIVEGTGTN